MSQFKIYYFLFISNNLHNSFTTEGSHVGLQLSVTSNEVLMIELRMSVVGLPSGVCLFYCYVED